MPESSGRWPRLVLTIPPEAMQALRELAAGNLRDPRREALRLVLNGLAHEKAGTPKS